MEEFFKKEYDNFDSYEYHFVDKVLKEIFGKRQMIKRYSLAGEGIFNLLYIDNYIYASLTQPPIKIIDKNDSDDELNYTVECPNCGSYVNYGYQIFMRSGHIYCNNKGCLEKLEESMNEKGDNK